MFAVLRVHRKYKSGQNVLLLIKYFAFVLSEKTSKNNFFYFSKSDLNLFLVSITVVVKGLCDTPFLFSFFYHIKNNEFRKNVDFYSSAVYDVRNS